MQKVAAVRVQAEDQLQFFKSKKGSFNGLHRRVKGYNHLGPVLTRPDGSSIPGRGGLVKNQIIKIRSGMELEKVTYYDAIGRKVLKERYEGHKLTRLELTEYDKSLNIPVAKWLLVRGDYLKHATQSSLVSGSKKKPYYYFNSVPAAN